MVLVPKRGGGIIKFEMIGVTGGSFTIFMIYIHNTNTCFVFAGVE